MANRPKGKCSLQQAVGAILTFAILGALYFWARSLEQEKKNSEEKHNKLIAERLIYYRIEALSLDLPTWVRDRFRTLENPVEIIGSGFARAVAWGPGHYNKQNFYWLGYIMEFEGKKRPVIEFERALGRQDASLQTLELNLPERYREKFCMYPDTQTCDWPALFEDVSKREAEAILPGLELMVWGKFP